MLNSRFSDIRSKAPLVTNVLNGRDDQLREFRETYFDRKYTHRCSVEDIVRQVEHRLKNVLAIAKEGCADESLEETWDVLVKSEVDEIVGMSLDYLISYARYPYGGLLCYELQRALRDLMVKLRQIENVPDALVLKIKTSELGAMQQMTKGLLAAVQIMHEQGDTHYLWLKKDVSCDSLLNIAKGLAGECLAARILHGDECCNLFAAAAVAKMLAICMKRLNDAQAMRVFIKALKFYKEARGNDADPRADPSMKELYEVFGLAAGCGLVADLPRVDEDRSDNSAQSNVTASSNEEYFHACSVCLARPTEVIYIECGHACLCWICSNTEMLPGNENVLDFCPVCRKEGSRKRFFAP